ncbi:hypothetical protein STEG23_018776 [Scotinomys teguina]
MWAWANPDHEEAWALRKKMWAWANPDHEEAWTLREDMLAWANPNDEEAWALRNASTSCLRGYSNRVFGPVSDFALPALILVQEPQQYVLGQREVSGWFNDVKKTVRLELRRVLQPLQVFAVSQTVQTASTLNRFAREVSEALQIRENINGQLHFGTEFLQEQVDILWIQQNLACDLGYHDMCVIAVIGGIVAGLVLIRRTRGSVRRSRTATKQALLAMKPSGDAQVSVAMI